ELLRCSDNIVFPVLICWVCGVIFLISFIFGIAFIDSGYGRGLHQVAHIYSLFGCIICWPKSTSEPTLLESSLFCRPFIELDGYHTRKAHGFLFSLASFCCLAWVTLHLLHILKTLWKRLESGRAR